MASKRKLPPLNTWIVPSITSAHACTLPAPVDAGAALLLEVAIAASLGAGAVADASDVASAPQLTKVNQTAIAGQNRTQRRMWTTISRRTGNGPAGAVCQRQDVC